MYAALACQGLHLPLRGQCVVCVDTSMSQVSTVYCVVPALRFK